MGRYTTLIGGQAQLELRAGSVQDNRGWRMFDKKCVYFWPVGTGDSTTFVVRENEIVFQVDLRHSLKSEDAETDCAPIIDYLEEHLPKRDGKPYLSTFAITHPDKDHIQGFEELLKRVTVGELWFTPRIFREHDDDPNGLGDDASRMRIPDDTASGYAARGMDFAGANSL